MNRFFKDGSIVLFQGDSVTDCERSRDNDDYAGFGYPGIFKTVYDSLFPGTDVKIVNRAVSGNRVRDLLERYDADFRDVRPDFISIEIGINDTWRAFDDSDPCSLERFTGEFDRLLTQIKRDLPQAQILLIPPYVLHSLPDRETWHPDLDPKIAAVKELAVKYSCLMMPLQELLNEAIAKGDFGMKELSSDGVHPEKQGHAFIACQLLDFLGIT